MGGERTMGWWEGRGLDALVKEHRWSTRHLQANSLQRSDVTLHVLVFQARKRETLLNLTAPHRRRYTLSPPSTARFSSSGT